MLLWYYSSAVLHYSGDVTKEALLCSYCGTYTQVLWWRHCSYTFIVTCDSEGTTVTLLLWSHSGVTTQ